MAETDQGAAATPEEGATPTVKEGEKELLLRWLKEAREQLSACQEPLKEVFKKHLSDEVIARSLFVLATAAVMIGELQLKEMEEREPDEPPPAEVAPAP